jgi:Rrf2 family protein
MNLLIFPQKISFRFIIWIRSFLYPIFNFYPLQEEPVQITRQADYAIRAILYLSEIGQDHPVATRRIAREKKIPPSFLAKIVSQLSLVGLLQTSRGATGGVQLSRSASHITLLEVIEAIDGPILLNDCVGSRSSCALENGCPAHSIFCQIRAELVQRLKNVTFEDMVLTSDPIQEKDYQHPPLLVGA